MFILENPAHFNLQTIMNSGQCFRIFEPRPDVYDVLSVDKWVRVYHAAILNMYTFDCPDADDLYWKTYFDLDQDYQMYFDTIYNSNDSFLKSAAFDVIRYLISLLRYFTSKIINKLIASNTLYW